MFCTLPDHILKREKIIGKNSIMKSRLNFSLPQSPCNKIRHDGPNFHRVQHSLGKFPIVIKISKVVSNTSVDNLSSHDHDKLELTSLIQLANSKQVNIFLYGYYKDSLEAILQSSKHIF